MRRHFCEVKSVLKDHLFLNNLHKIGLWVDEQKKSKFVFWEILQSTFTEEKNERHIKENNNNLIMIIMVNILTNLQEQLMSLQNMHR